MAEGDLFLLIFISASYYTKGCSEAMYSVEVDGLIIYFSHLESLVSVSFQFLGDCNAVLQDCKMCSRIESWLP